MRLMRALFPALLLPLVPLGALSVATPAAAEECGLRPETSYSCELPECRPELIGHIRWSNNVEFRCEAERISDYSERYLLQWRRTGQVYT